MLRSLRRLLRPSLEDRVEELVDSGEPGEAMRRMFELTAMVMDATGCRAMVSRLSPDEGEEGDGVTMLAYVAGVDPIVLLSDLESEDDDDEDDE